MLTEQQQNDILDHVLVDRAAWEQHAIATLGAQKAAQAKLAKAMRWKASYDAAALAVDYAPRSARWDEARQEFRPAVQVGAA